VDERMGWDGNWFYCRVPLEQTTDVRGKGLYPLSYTMTPLNYVMEVTFDCGPVDIDVAAFTEAASIIGGCDAVEEFLACGMWPLSENFGFKVETKETPLSKVVVLMPQVTPVIGVQELGLTLEVRISTAACLLVGNYNIAEHNAYKGLRHGRLNQVFELASMLCQPRLEPIVCKWKAAAPVPPPQKTGKKWWHARGSPRSWGHTSTQELALAKALKSRKKFSLGSSGLILAEKASATNVGIHGGKEVVAPHGCEWQGYDFKSFGSVRVCLVCF
jgi:hypothetical protein